MPKTLPPCGVKPLRDRGSGFRVFAQQKSLHVRVNDIGRVQEIKQFARDRVGRFGKGNQPVDRFGKFSSTARTVAHLPSDEARVNRARAHDAGQRDRKCSGPRPLRIGHVEHDEIGRTAEHLCRRGKAADKGDVLGAFEQIARRIVARMDQKVRARDALRESIRRRAALSFGAAITVRSAGKVRCTDRLGVNVAAEQVFDAGAVSAGSGTEDAMKTGRAGARRARRAGFRRRLRRARRRLARRRR